MYKKRYRVDVARCFSNSSSQQKKGQVTIFIIIGVLLLLALVLIIALQKEIVTFKSEEVIPTEKGKIQNFLTACIKSLGEEALTQLGAQGGYVEVPSDIASNGDLHLRASSFHVVPYWAYGETVAVPSLQEIKQGIDNHIEKGLRKCLFGLGAFQETYDLIERSDIKADTDILSTKVVFNVKWDVEIKNKAGEVVTEIINHAAESKVKLKRVYEAAKNIIEKEMRDYKFEDLTQDLIALEHPKVPLAGLEVSCRKKKWKISEVKTTLQELLRVNLGVLKVKGTEFEEFSNQFPYYQNHYVWNLGEDFLAPDISVVFRYDSGFPFAFDVRPRSGNYLRSGQLGGNNNLIDFFCIQNWKFVYDVTYPVLVDIRDETTDYSFKMAFTVHLQNNIPDRRATAFDQKSVFFDTFTDEEFCQDRDVPMTVFTYELVENNFGVYNREPLEGVDLSYTCLRYKCPIGETEYNFGGMGNVAAYRTNYPYCAGGILRGEKENYKEVWKRVVTSSSKTEELELTPLFTFPSGKIGIVKHDQLSGDQVAEGSILGDDETALVRLTYTKRNSSEPFHEITFLISSTLDSEVVNKQEIDFLAKADFTYNLEITVLKGSDFVAGYKREWILPWYELSTAQEIIFHVIGEENQNEEEQFLFIADLGELSKKVPLPEIN